ncbi:MAG: hypothetical protein CM15mP38_3160 [Synechococcus sp.]|nr:MAG: hypothetical protein CM15mP38_3160 [Synechococcus sp.]
MDWFRSLTEIDNSPLKTRLNSWESLFLTRQHALQILELSNRQRLDDFQFTTSKTFSTKTSHLP